MAPWHQGCYGDDSSLPTEEVDMRTACLSSQGLLLVAIYAFSANSVCSELVHHSHHPPSRWGIFTLDPRTAEVDRHDQAANASQFLRTCEKHDSTRTQHPSLPRLVTHQLQLTRERRDRLVQRRVSQQLFNRLALRRRDLEPLPRLGRRGLVLQDHEEHFTLVRGPVEMQVDRISEATGQGRPVLGRPPAKHSPEIRAGTALSQGLDCLRVDRTLRLVCLPVCSLAFFGAVETDEIVRKAANESDRSRRLTPSGTSRTS